jgi:hypothetical protein
MTRTAIPAPRSLQWSAAPTAFVAACAMLLAPAARSAQPADAPEPAVQTSTAAAPVARAPVAATRAPAPSRPAPAVGGSGAAAPATGGARAKDRVELETTQITGNRELPNVMYVVPWKKPEMGEFSGRPPKSLLDELLAPVDREVFQRQNRYYTALRPDTAAGQRAGGTAEGPAPRGEGKGEGVPAAPAGRNAVDER